MEGNKLKLFKVSGFIDKLGFDKRISSIDVEEKGKSYIGEGKRISKDKIMKIDTLFHENNKYIRYYTYCLDGQQQ